MRTSVASLVVLLLVGHLHAAVVPNATFANDTTGWTQVGSVTVSQIPNGGPDGSGCARLANASGLPNGITSNMFAIEPQIGNAGYDFSIWIDRVSLGTWAAVQVDLTWYDSQGVSLGSFTPVSGLNGTADWQQFSAHIASLPAGTTQGKVTLRLDYGGWYADFDDVVFAATLSRPSIQAMLDAGGTVTLPRGTYNIDSSLFFNHAGTKLTGSKDSILVFQPGVNIWGLNVRAPDCQISDITIQGNWAQGGQINAGTSGIRVEAMGEGCRIQRVTVTKQTGNAIRLDGVSDVRIEGCTVDDFGYNGIFLQPDTLGHCSSVVISGCQIGGTRASNGNCIFVQGQGNFGAHNITITSNICTLNSDFGIEVGEVFDGYHTSIIVANNIVENASNAGIGIRSVNNGVISGNRISNCGSTFYGGDGIFITGDGKLCQGLTVCGNSVTMKNATGPNNFGIHVTNYEKVIVSNNSIDTAYRGIYLEGESGRSFKYCTLSDNTIKNTAGAIRVYGQAGYENILIQGNSLYTCTNGIEVTAEPNQIQKFIIVTNNQIRDCTSNAITFFLVQKSRCNYNYRMNSGVISISSCTDVTQTGNVAFSP